MIKHAISTEKTIRMIEMENKLVFAVDQKASKEQIKAEIERLFNAKVVRINTLTAPDGTKRAIVKFDVETPAIDVATKLGMM